MSKRHIGRTLAVQYLYSFAFNPLPKEAVANFMLDSNKGNSDEAYNFALLLYFGVVDNLPTIDENISKLLQNWTLDRVKAVDLAILRLATYELLFQPATARAVVINEAVVLAKEFCGDDSYKFINGILEKIGG